jgi:RNA polymerase sigma-70 factor (ECF subfamily)
MDAFEELTVRFEKRIYGFLCRHIGNAHDAQDVTQETFVRAWRAIGRFDPTRDFATWLFVIARRAAANHFRARRNHDELSNDLAAAEAVESRGDEKDDLWRVAKKLKNKSYEALWLRYGEGFSVAQTARVMGLTTIHVKVILHRARKELARRIKRD